MRARDNLASVGLVLVIGFLGSSAGGAGAQELPLKRELPSRGPSPCAEPSGPPAEPAGEEVREAARISTAASQASILGDHEGARELLARAVALNPSSPGIAYQYARSLEELGESRAAVEQYCRYLALAPLAADSEDVEGRIAALSDSGASGVSGRAAAEFQSGLEHFDEGRPNQAAQAFTAALVQDPEWAEAYHNRALAYERMGLARLAVEDLQRYVSLQPGAPDRAEVERRIQQLAGSARPVPAARLYSPAGAMVRGLVVPGWGQLYTGRPLAGLTVLALAGGAAAFGLLYEEVQIQCSAPPVDGECRPPAEERERKVDRPYEIAGLATAGGITLLAALNAYLGARSRNVASALRADAPAGWGRLRLQPPAAEPIPGGVRLDLVRLRF